MKKDKTSPIWSDSVVIWYPRIPDPQFPQFPILFGLQPDGNRQAVYPDQEGFRLAPVGAIKLF